MKKVSIVLPSYNRANLITQTIESCLKQTYSNIELIIVDDYSTDNTIEIIKPYLKDKRIKLIQNFENKKLPATLNIGFTIARGEYLTWISDDNLFTTTAVEIMVNALNNNPDIGLVYADYTTINNEGKKISRIYQEPPEYLPIRDCVGACFLYRATVAQSVGKYNENLFLVEDYEYFLRLGLITKMMHIQKSLYFYRVHKAALTQQKKEEIRLAKNELKKLFANKYYIPPYLAPINELYLWFINKHGILSYFKLVWIIIKSPIKTLSYITQNFVRMRK